MLDLFRARRARVFYDAPVWAVGLLAVSMTATSSAQPTDFPYRNIRVETGLSVFTTGDFNGDGVTDVATAAEIFLFDPFRRQGRMTVLLSNPDTGSPSRQAFDIQPDQPAGIAAGDFDGDGDADLAVIGRLSGDLCILLNSGGGSFNPMPCSSVQSPEGLWVADLNGDGLQDLALKVSNSDSISLLRSQGDGTFADAGTVEMPNRPRDVILADFDGDGLSDLAATMDPLNNTLIFENEGGFSFRQRREIQTVDRPVLLASGDFNNDGRVDLAVTNSPSGLSPLGVILNLGGFNFAASTPTASLDSVSAITVVDLDRDGFSDIVCSARSTRGQQMVTIQSDGAGGFRSPSAFMKQGSESITAADVDGDQSPEILSIYESGGSSVVSIADVDPDGSLFSPDEQLIPIENPRAIATGDFDGDGDVDSAISSLTTFDNEQIGLFLNDGDGTLAFSESFPVAPGPNSLVFTDFDLDGDQDLVAASGNIFYPPARISLFENVGETLASPVEFPVPANASLGDMRCADLNGDELPDVIWRDFFPPFMYVRLNQGGTSLGPTLGFRIHEEPTSYQVVDIDMDGDLDIVYVTARASTNSLESPFVGLLRNTGGSASLFSDFETLLTLPDTPTNTFLEVADIDNNGTMDLVILTKESETNPNTGSVAGASIIRFLNNDGAGFTAMAPVDMPIPDVFGLSIGDYNGNGSVDASSATPGGFALAQDLGEEIPEVYEFDHGISRPSDAKIDSADLDADGSAELIIAGSGSSGAGSGVGELRVVSRQQASSAGCNIADLAEPNGVLDLTDISVFVTGFTALDPVADLAEPFGTFDLADISAFVTAFSAGCP